jgi:hypothetical protein
MQTGASSNHPAGNQPETIQQEMAQGVPSADLQKRLHGDIKSIK